MQAPVAIVVLSVAVSLCRPALASAQTSFKALASALPVTAPAGPATTTAAPNRLREGLSQTPETGDELTVSVHPVLLWIPSFSTTTSVPPFPDVPDGPDLPGASGSTSASFDGAALVGFSVDKAGWRLDVDGIWAAVTSERERPLLKVDLDVIYGHLSGGRRVYKDLYLTAGVRRIALKYDIQLADRTPFVRKPGIWDPLIGLGWHSGVGSRIALHMAAAGGGFGVGADVDLSASIRADVRLTRHFGLALGYAALYLRLSDTVLERRLDVKQTMHGPLVGLGFYF